MRRGSALDVHRRVVLEGLRPRLGRGDLAQSLAVLLGQRVPAREQLGVQLGARYDGSPIVVADGTPPADDLFDYKPSAVPGGRAPHVWIGEKRETGDSLFDRFGPGFTVLRLGRKAAKADGLLAAFARNGVPVKVVETDSAVARDLYERDIVVVRPDQHVAWRGNADPSDAEAVVAQMTGRRP